MNKTVKVILGLFIGMVLLAGAFSGGFIAGHFLPIGKNGPAISAPPGSVPSNQGSTPAELQTLFQPFWETWTLVHEQYVDQPVDDVALMRGAIQGMLDSLGDKHTSYMSPEEFKQANEDLAGEYEGIGAYVDISGDYLTVISPISGSPAEAAGLRNGDIIIAIDGQDMTGVNPELARQRVLGPAGSVVTLTIRRGDEAPLDVKITRAKIIVHSAEGKMLDDGIAYVEISTFGEKTSQELKDTLAKLMAENPKGLILDLRNNGGGYKDTAVEVASEFIPKGKVVLYEQYGSGQKNSDEALGDGLAENIPMVVLINEGSASASEIVAGALQDYGRAKLVGVVSYGKGSVQIWDELSNNQGAVRVTIAKWLTPDGRAIDKTGLTPEVYVSMTEDDYNNDRDPQLDAAIQTLLAMLAGSPLPTSMPTVTPIP